MSAIKSHPHRMLLVAAMGATLLGSSSVYAQVAPGKNDKACKGDFSACEYWRGPQLGINPLTKTPDAQLGFSFLVPSKGNELELGVGTTDAKQGFKGNIALTLGSKDGTSMRGAFRYEDFGGMNQHGQGYVGYGFHEIDGKTYMSFMPIIGVSDSKMDLEDPTRSGEKRDPELVGIHASQNAFVGLRGLIAGRGGLFEALCKVDVTGNQRFHTRDASGELKLHETSNGNPPTECSAIAEKTIAKIGKYPIGLYVEGVSTRMAAPERDEDGNWIQGIENHNRLNLGAKFTGANLR